MFSDPINYVGTVIRPPSEADSLIFQVTHGCSDNNCTFCPAYKDKPFQIKDINDIKTEIKTAAKYYSDTRRIFLADGDAIVIPQALLKTILSLLIEHFPKLSRVSLYGSAKSIKTKSVSELAELKTLKLGMLYIGVETGDEEVYESINKYGSPKEVIESILKVKEAGIKTNVTVILGLGGRKLSRQHALNTAKLLNDAQPDQIAALTLMIVEGTPIYNMKKSGKFIELEGFDFVEELKLLIENLADFRCLFFANHASNYVPIAARFPTDKAQTLKSLELILAKRKSGSLKSEWLRGL